LTAIRFLWSFRMMVTVAARRLCIGFSLVCFAAAVWIGPVARAAEAPSDKSEKPEELPEPEDLELETKDGVALGVTYYASLEGKDAVPVILLHGLKGDRKDLSGLALYLQSVGQAVVVPDLRGHGDSIRMKRPGGVSGRLDASRLSKTDVIAMSSNRGDVEAVKKFLMKENNQGKLNIEKLCVIGAGMGATVAVNWAALDWSWPQLPGRKQGQDVKALVLISPEWSFKGVPITAAINTAAVRQAMSVMLIVGAGDASTKRDAQRILKTLEKYHAPPPSDPKEAAEKQDLFYREPNTSLSGVKMLRERSLALNEVIGTFIQLRLVNKKFPWTDRSRD
jgi:pimeloyl-ACP methyl ester carboxylesterase